MTGQRVWVFVLAQILVLWTGTARPAENNPFTHNRNGTVTYLKTGTMWQKDDDGKERTWSHSVSYCAGLTLAGHSDWRLPGMEDLVPLWEEAGSRPNIRKVYFPTMRDSAYWS